ncbi:hypothetical protein DVH05_001240 [Phytophthora capsici]|nr:hypothetical protein DVH05_001240 [Phytophthora capsici]
MDVTDPIVPEGDPQGFGFDTPYELDLVMPTPEEAGSPGCVADPIVPEVDPTDVGVAPATAAASATAAQRQPGRLRRPTNEKPDDDQDDGYDVVEDTRYEYTNVLGSRYFRDDRQAFLVACAPSYVPADNLEPEDLAAAYEICGLKREPAVRNLLATIPAGSMVTVVHRQLNFKGNRHHLKQGRIYWFNNDFCFGIFIY